MPQHHRAGPDLPDGIGDSFARDVGRRAVHRLKHGRELLFGIEIRGRSDSDGTGNRGSQVRKNIAEKIRADHHVKPVGMADEVCRQNVDVILIGANVGIAGAHRAKTFVPKRHGVDDAVGLGGRSQMFISLARQGKSVAQNAVDAAPRENGLLHGGLFVGAFVDAAANVGILAFVVLANDGEVDLSRLPVFQGTLDAFQQANRPQIHVLLESAADGNQESPEREVIGNVGMPDRAEEDGVERTELLEAVRRHHPACSRVGFAAPVEGSPLELKAEAAPGGIEHANALGNHFLADTVSGDHRDVKGLHVSRPSAAAQRRQNGDSLSSSIETARDKSVSEAEPGRTMPARTGGPASGTAMGAAIATEALPLRRKRKYGGNPNTSLPRTSDAERGRRRGCAISWRNDWPARYPEPRAFSRAQSECPARRAPSGPQCLPDASLRPRL